MQTRHENSAPTVVGYNASALNSGNYTMINVPFEHVTADGKGLMLNSDITVANPTRSNVYGSADQIWVWVASKGGYDHFYINNSGQWVMQGNRKPFEQATGYENGLPLGSGLYYNAKVGTDKALTGSGAVESEPEVEQPVNSGNYTMLANAYPVPLFLNTATQFEAGNPTRSNVYGSADQIWVWVASKGGYDHFYINNSGQWVMQGNRKPFEQATGYENGLPAGTAFYYNAKAGNDKSVVFKKNF